jgi:hypothetical protein
VDEDLVEGADHRQAVLEMHRDIRV